ncbi:flavin-containing monooxygenase [Agitococcus lubricus]|uniref:Cation diffusion facilitator CzcD-associated flavoprotein CzcO n=1 Tax=Agitococcus lubricus TaxID=1077255 RepID=A0A2T5IYF2_9GAMM|nr:NAD(P)/FAD-dependent oxidoreductase [Agitococcus lubricus]PTQ89013.1 cation diffusion facilitator CzcD-associated flavoprotein CzcO [Agitococcus lubricus]
MQIQHTEIAIIGSGFGGVGIAIQLQQAGFNDFILLEKEKDVGGCWRDNSYPAAACDVPSHLYSFSFAPNAKWSRKFAPQAEIYRYIRDCVERYQLMPHIRFNSEVAGAQFDAVKGVWQIRTVNGDMIHARILISGCGQLNRPAYPKLKGIDRFQGQIFHSARWNHDIDLNQKRIAVIGTGASAIQFVPEVAKKAKSLVLFQRSAPYVIPKPDRAYSRLEQAVYAKLPALQQLSRAVMYGQHEARALAFTSLNKVAMKPYSWQFLRYLRQQVPNPELRAKLTPDYPLGCKRILISNDYYPALCRSNVNVVTEGISEITAQGVKTKDGQEYPVDVIIYGTGFQATDFLAPMSIRGLEGQDLNQAWRDGAEAYLGITVSGFPNLFLLYGPNTNLGHNSIVYMLESQFAYIMDAIKQMRQHQWSYVNVRQQVQGVYNQWVQKQVKNSVWDGGCTSWYKTESGKNTNNWPGFTLVYRHKTRQFNAKEYDVATQKAPLVAVPA